LDARHAGLAFWQGVCQLAQGEAALARAMFEQARDLDALPFRVDAPLNAVVAEVAQRRRPDGLRFYDAAVELAKLSRAGIPGEDLFYDHVHLNFDGNYRLALGLAAEVERALGEKLTGAKSETWAGADLCAQRLGLTDWNRDAALAEMLVRLGEPPFRQVAGLTSLAQYCQARLESVRARLKPEAMAPAQALYAEALRHAPNDPRMHANYAEFLEATGRLGDALSEWRRVAELLPHHHAADFWIGRILARQGNTAEARRSFEACLRRRPDLVDAWVELGNLARREGQPTLAIEHYRAALRLQPWNSAVLLQLAHAQAAAGDRASAVSTLRQAVGARPDHWQARYYLGVELATANQISEATIEFAEVVRIKPDFALGHLNLGVAKVRQGQVLEALLQFRETLRLDPQNARAQEYVRLLTKTNEVSP
jgi:tetratricopeptide (TPR) repeat protein